MRVSSYSLPQRAMHFSDCTVVVSHSCPTPWGRCTAFTLRKTRNQLVIILPLAKLCGEVARLYDKAQSAGLPHAQIPPSRRHPIIRQRRHKHPSFIGTVSCIELKKQADMAYLITGKGHW